MKHSVTQRGQRLKVDLVMWTKNSAKFLPITLKRIDEVIPCEYVNQKVIVDDRSQDNTVDIARDFGWKVFSNPKTGIPSGANKALRHVQTKFFISVEHDVFFWRRLGGRRSPLICQIQRLLLLKASG